MSKSRCARAAMKARLSPLVEVIVAVGTAWCSGLERAWCSPEACSPGSLVLFIWYLGKMYKPMQELSKMTDAYSKAAVAYERIREVMDMGWRRQGSCRARAKSRGMKGAIEFDHVTFGYDPKCAHPRRHEFPHRGGPAGGVRRPDRRRQDYDHQPDFAILRSGLGQR